ncbi:MAG: amylo-alpha-1,6-glucosidase [Waterburya sp.]
MSISFGREICGEIETAQEREWLVTNGIGGYASGTVAGVLTRSYHGLLIAALQPPLERTLLLTKIDDTVEYNGQSYPLFSNRWQGNSVDPKGYEYIQSFHLEATIPVWDFTLSDAVLEKRIWMQPKANTTYMYYTLKRASEPINLSLKALVNYRSYHGGELPGLKSQESLEKGVRIIMDRENVEPFYLFVDKGNTSLANEPYYNFQLPIENYRGLNDIDSHLHVATFDVTLQPGESLTFVACTEDPNPLMAGRLDVNNTEALAKVLDGAKSLENRRNYEQELLKVWQETNGEVASTAPDWIKQLVLAADQFIVDRRLGDNREGKSVIAGYHWFEDWGRDTMISLPGLTLITGRQEIARLILETFAQYVSKGMLPNRFPNDDSLTDSDYNTVDATLWYFEAIRLYHAQTKDNDFLNQIFPKLEEIIGSHRQGTRYNIRLDRDGLIAAGEEGVQLTWMDALVNGQVITPRRGKPIEVNALWYNALLTMSAFAKTLGKDSSQYDEMAQTAKKGFERFWNQEKGYCFDVLDSPDGTNDVSLRPNQLFALSLPESPLNQEQQLGVIKACEQFLLTSHGLRSLSPEDSQYQGQYGGDQYHRDSSYHQGTVWGWLMGPFALAHLRVYNDPNQALSFLEPMAYHLTSTGLGNISEIFDGNAPYPPRGCIAQAWSVAEVLRAWLEIAKNLDN